jgi:hypothetical protein
MSRKIDVSEIIRAHYRTLYDNRHGRLSRVDLLLFFVLPLIVAVTATVAGARLGAAGSLLGAVSILGGFLFALLVLVLQMSADAAARTEEENGPSPRILRRVKVLREVSANVAYSVLASILTTISLVVGDLVLVPSTSPRLEDLGQNSQQPAWISAVSIFLLSHLALTLLMVLRRVFSVTQRELDFAAVHEGRDRAA